MSEVVTNLVVVKTAAVENPVVEKTVADYMVDNINLKNRKLKLEKEISKISETDTAKDAKCEELNAVINQMLVNNDLIKALKKPVKVEVKATPKPVINTEDMMSEVRSIVGKIIIDNDYFYIQRHNCYYKRTAGGKLEDVLVSSLKEMHPILKDKTANAIFDELMDGRRYHDIAWSWKEESADTLNLMTTKAIAMVKPDASFQQHYFDLLVEVACGDHEENREFVERWLMWKYLHPEDWNMSALVLFRTGGAGKNLLFEAIPRVIWGKGGVCKVGGEAFFDSFNDDQLGSAITFIEEMDFDKTNVNKLKERVKQEHWNVNGKFKRRITVDTTMAFVLATNDVRGGIPLNRDNVDRRWSIIQCKRSLVEVYNDYFHEGQLTDIEATEQWESIAENIIKDPKQVAMWLWHLNEKLGDIAKPTVLHGIDYQALLGIQSNPLDAFIDRVICRDDFDYLSVELAYVIYKEVCRSHGNSHNLGPGTFKEKLINEMKRRKLPVMLHDKKAFYDKNGNGRSKAFLINKSHENAGTLIDNDQFWMDIFLDDNAALCWQFEKARRQELRRKAE